MTKQEFIETIESKYQYELLDGTEGFQLFVDDFFGDFVITLNNDNAFDIRIDVFDIHHDMNYGFEKSPSVFALAYYKIIAIALKNELCDTYALIGTQAFDANRGFVHIVSLHSEKYDVDLINRIFEKLVSTSRDTDVFQSDAYDQALLETVYNDDDYKENDHYHLEDNKLVSKSRNAMIFTGNINDALPNCRLEKFVEADDVFIGIKYAVIKNDKLNKTAVIESRYIRTFNKISEEYEIAEMKYYSDFSHLVYVESEKLKFVGAIIKINEIAIANEYELLYQQICELKRIVPRVPINTSYDLSHLSADEFEMLCFDLLNNMGFQDVKRIGATNAPDGGKDVLAYEEYKTLFNTERRKWIFQCKHSKKSLDRKEISEIDDLMEENNAQCYGLFCSNIITPDTVNRLENKKARLKGFQVIQYYGKTEISVMVEKYPDLVNKYNLLRYSH